MRAIRASDHLIRNGIIGGGVMKLRGASCFTPAILLLLYPVAVWAQPTTLGAPAAQAPGQTAREAPVTFKAETNLVLVPVVVRDAKGNAVGGLGKEDFRLSQDGRSQVGPAPQRAVVKAHGGVH